MFDEMDRGGHAVLSMRSDGRPREGDLLVERSGLSFNVSFFKSSLEMGPFMYSASEPELFDDTGREARGECSGRRRKSPPPFCRFGAIPRSPDCALIGFAGVRSSEGGNGS